MSRISNALLSLTRACLAVAVLLVAGCGVDRGGGGVEPFGTLPDLGSGGSCAHCAPGQMCCGAKCVDVTVDAKNCGACNHACAAGETCKGSVCSCYGAGHCPMGQACCMGGCKTLNTDAENCGTCGNSCESQNPGETCFQGKCGCGTGDTHCTNPEACCSNACTDITKDTANCGTCGTACPNMGMCTASMCAGGGMMMGGKCTTDADCAMGQMCLGNMCLMFGGGGGGCGTDADCMNGQKCTAPFMGFPCNKILPICMCK